ncbi:MAG: helix-turn-helix domain-containing protein [bacterium]
MNKSINNLMKLGFSENDAAVYLALAELKSATSNPLITNTGLHRSLVYTSLEHLVARKLVSEFETKGKKTFSIVSPDILIEEFEEKQRIAEDISKNIKQKMTTETQEITIHKGNDEYLALLTSLIKQLPKGGTKYIIGSGGEDFMEETMRPIWKKYHNAVDDASITIKMIGYKNQKESFQRETEREGSYNIKYLESDTENPAGVHIYPEAGVVLNIIYSNKEQPVTAIKIKDHNLVKGYLNLFNTLWNN